MISYVYLLAVLLLFNNYNTRMTQTHHIKWWWLIVTSNGREGCGLGKTLLFRATFFYVVFGVHHQLTTTLRGEASLFEGQAMEEEKESQQQ